MAALHFIQKPAPLGIHCSWNSVWFHIACELDQQRLGGKDFALQYHCKYWCTVAFGVTLRVLRIQLLLWHVNSGIVELGE